LIPRPDNGGDDVDEEASCVATVLTSDLCILFSSPLSDSPFLVDFLGKDYEKINCLVFFSGFSIHFRVFDAFRIRFDFTPKKLRRDFWP